MKKKINLEEIANNNITYQLLMDKHQQLATISLMKEACKQTLELTVENAKINCIENNIKIESDYDYSFKDNDGNWCKININEQSILDTIKKIK